MRIRSIKPEFFKSESIGRLSRDARLLYIGLWCYADDEGRCRGVSQAVACDLFPYDDDARAKINEWMVELEREGMIVRYRGADGNSYLAVPKFRKHQLINRASKSKLPPPPEPSVSPPLPFTAPSPPAPCPIAEPSVNTHGALSEPSVSPHNRSYGAMEQGAMEQGTGSGECKGAVAPAAGAASPPDDNNEAPPLALSSEPPPKPAPPLAGAEKLAAEMDKANRRRANKPDPLASLAIPILLDTEPFRAAWAKWTQHRREIKEPLTMTSAALQLEKFLTWGEARAIAAINHTILKGWQGIREPDAPAGNGTPPRAGPGNIGAIAGSNEVTHPTHDFGLGQLSDGSFITPAGKKIIDQRPNNVF